VEFELEANRWQLDSRDKLVVDAREEFSRSLDVLERCEAQCRRHKQNRDEWSAVLRKGGNTDAKCGLFVAAIWSLYPLLDALEKMAQSSDASKPPNGRVSQGNERLEAILQALESAQGRDTTRDTQRKHDVDQSHRAWTAPHTPTPTRQVKHTNSPPNRIRVTISTGHHTPSEPASPQRHEAGQRLSPPRNRIRLCGKNKGPPARA